MATMYFCDICGMLLVVTKDTAVTGCALYTHAAI